VKVVIDTNVLISGAFFSGPPYEILVACATGRLQLILSIDIPAEYHRMGFSFLHEHSDVDFESLLGILLKNAVILDNPGLENPICRDPDDDKFIACALGGNADVIISGDKDLLALANRIDIPVMKPKDFLIRYLK
jgi:putative PIN family toxin of toxin-antitoxin system